MTAATLKSYTHKDLAEMARQGGVRGWHSMRKDQLVKALLAHRSKPTRLRAKTSIPVPAPTRRSSAAKSPIQRERRVISRPARSKPAALPARRPAVAATSSVAALPATPARPVAPQAPVHRPTVSRAQQARSNRVASHVRATQAKFEQSQNLANGSTAANGAARKDRIVVMVRDSFWLHAFWEVTRQNVERARAAMGQDWHLAKPTLRVLEISDTSATSASERVAQQIDVHGGVNNWYIHVTDAPKTYRLEIGYLGRSGKFFALSRSNVVTTPAPGASDALDENWADVARNFEKIYAMSGGYASEGGTELQELFEERLRRPMGSSLADRCGASMEGMFATPRDLEFSVDAEMIIFGSTRPDARVTMRGEPVRLRPDGTFTVRMSLPNQRQVIPIVAYAASGSEQRTVVLAVERNTKVMEPVLRESSAE
jgi:hypothetical protein